MSGSESNWNEEIDEFARANGLLNERKIEVARTDLHQAILNRVKVSLAQDPT